MSELVDRATTEIAAEGCLPQSVSRHASARDDKTPGWGTAHAR
jgi:hypothetical protein